jgi:hypothetical protein
MELSRGSYCLSSKDVEKMELENNEQVLIKKLVKGRRSRKT